MADDDGRDEGLASLFERAYRAEVDVETASRHLWRIHTAATRRRRRDAPLLGHRRRTGARWPTVAAVVAALIALPTSAAIGLGSGAEPGQMLYSLRVQYEAYQASAQWTPESRAEAYLDYAERRLADLATVHPGRLDLVPWLLERALEAVEDAEQLVGETDRTRFLRREIEASAGRYLAAADAQTRVAIEALLAELRGEEPPAVAAEPDEGPREPAPRRREDPEPVPTEEPTGEPTEAPTGEPTEEPTGEPTEAPTEAPTEEPTGEPTEAPTEAPTEEPTEAPTGEPTEAPTGEPTEAPTEEPTGEPTEEPTEAPTEERTGTPTPQPPAPDGP